MKDKISKLKNLVKKYGLKGTVKKALDYIYSNYLVRLSLREWFLLHLHRKTFAEGIGRILERDTYDRIVIWRSSFGWDVPLYQRPQHIFSNFARQRTLVFYEVTRFTDDVKRMKKQADNLYLVNFANTAFANLLMREIAGKDVPRYVQFYSTDWTMPAKKIEEYKKQGYQIVYEYIDDLNPHLAGTDELPVNVREKYEMAMKDPEIFVVVTAGALERDVLEKRGRQRLVYSGNGVDYTHFHDEVDEDFVPDEDFRKIIDSGKPVIGYYGALAKWFDYDLIKEIDAAGKYQLILLGIKYDDSFDRAGLDRCRNVHFCGSRDYHVLQNYASKIDILTIPFLINDITKATSPVKLFEYMALNKPIVTTVMDECRKYEYVLIGHDHREFMEQLDRAMDLREDPAYRALLDKEALENTWAEKAKSILDELKKYE